MTVKQAIVKGYQKTCALFKPWELEEAKELAQKMRDAGFLATVIKTKSQRANKQGECSTLLRIFYKSK